MRDNLTVVVDGERVTQVGPSASIQLPKNAERITNR